jgi:hypothetical protein
MLNEDSSYLFDLIRFRHGVPRLEVENLDNTLAGENVVAPINSLGEAKLRKQRAKIAETDVRIRGTSQYF